MSDPMSTEARLDSGDRRMKDIEDQLIEVRSELKRNSELTQDIRDILTATKVGLKVLGGIGQLVRWLGFVAGGVLAIWGAWQAFLHQAKP